MRKLFAILFLLSGVLILLAPAHSQGAGLVSCGGEGQPACNLCHLFELIKNIIDFVLIPTALNGGLAIVFVIAGLLFAIGGFFLFASAGNPQNLGRAKTIIFAAVIGLFIIYGSYVFVGLLLQAMGVLSWTGLDTWWQIECGEIFVPPPVAYWKFDETSGSTAADSMGGPAGNVSGATWVHGKIGNALQFDGLDDHVQVPSSAATQVKSDMSLAAWIRLDEVDKGSQDIITKYHDPNALEHEYNFTVADGFSGGTIRVNQPVFGTYQKDDPGTVLDETGSDHGSVIANASLVKDTWYHVAITFGDTIAARIYIDGKKDATKDSAKFVGTLILGSATPVRIGGRIDSASFFFRGIIDDVKIWNAVLTDEQVLAEFSKGS